MCVLCLPVCQFARDRLDVDLPSNGLTGQQANGKRTNLDPLSRRLGLGHGELAPS